MISPRDSLLIVMCMESRAGASEPTSRPQAGYDNQRLADDVLHVFDSLKIGAPVLVGHSMAGAELTTLGNQHSDRLAGLVYLDALGDLKDWPGSDPGYIELFKKLPTAMRGSPSPLAKKSPGRSVPTEPG